MTTIRTEKKKAQRKTNTTQAQRDLAVTMYVEGQGIKEIVERTGVSTATLYNELKARGISKRNPDSHSGRPRK